MIIALLLLASLVLLGCEGPDPGSLTQPQSYGDFRDNVRSTYRPEGEEAAIFANLGLEVEDFNNMATWTPEQVAALEIGFHEILYRGLEAVTAGGDDSVLAQSMRSSSETGEASARHGRVHVEVTTEMVEPISSELVEVWVEQPDGSFTTEFRVVSVWPDDVAPLFEQRELNLVGDDNE